MYGIRLVMAWASTLTVGMVSSNIIRLAKAYWLVSLGQGLSIQQPESFILSILRAPQYKKGYTILQNLSLAIMTLYYTLRVALIGALEELL